MDLVESELVSGFNVEYWVEFVLIFIAQYNFFLM